jgi:hypothetical protein
MSCRWNNTLMELLEKRLEQQSTIWGGVKITTKNFE